MARYTKRQYNLQVAAAMAIYVLLILFEWPRVSSVSNLALKTALAVLPTLPVVVVIALLARLVLASDEMQQRMHLIALSTALGVVGAASVFGGFLAMAGVWHVGGDVLFYVFPLLCVVYGVGRGIAGRRVAGSWRFWTC